MSEPERGLCWREAAAALCTHRLLDTSPWAHRPVAATSSAAAVTHFRIKSGRNSLRGSRCQTGRNKLHFIEYLPAEIGIPKTFLTRPLLEERDTTRDLSLRDLCLPQKWDMCGNQEVLCQSGRPGCLEVRWRSVQILAQPLEDRGTNNRNNYFAPCDLCR